LIRPVASLLNHFLDLLFACLQECHIQHGRSKTKTEENGRAVSCLSQANMLPSTSKRAQKRKVARELDSLSKRLCCFIMDLFDKTKPLPPLAATNAASATNTG